MQAELSTLKDTLLSGLKENKDDQIKGVESLMKSITKSNESSQNQLQVCKPKTACAYNIAQLLADGFHSQYSIQALCRLI